MSLGRSATDMLESGPRLTCDQLATCLRRGGSAVQERRRITRPRTRVSLAADGDGSAKGRRRDGARLVGAGGEDCDHRVLPRRDRIGKSPQPLRDPIGLHRPACRDDAHDGPRRVDEGDPHRSPDGRAAEPDGVGPQRAALGTGRMLQGGGDPGSDQHRLAAAHRRGSRRGGQAVDRQQVAVARRGRRASPARAAACRHRRPSGCRSLLWRQRSRCSSRHRWWRSAATGR